MRRALPLVSACSRPPAKPPPPAPRPPKQNRPSPQTEPARRRHRTEAQPRRTSPASQAEPGQRPKQNQPATQAEPASDPSRTRPTSRNHDPEGATRGLRVPRNNTASHRRSPPKAGEDFCQRRACQLWPPLDHRSHAERVIPVASVAAGTSPRAADYAPAGGEPGKARSTTTRTRPGSGAARAATRASGHPAWFRRRGLGPTCPMWQARTFRGCGIPIRGTRC